MGEFGWPSGVHAAVQTDRGRLRYIEPSACAQPPRVHDGAETPSAISLKQASTIAEMRRRTVASAPPEEKTGDEQQHEHQRHESQCRVEQVQDDLKEQCRP